MKGKELKAQINRIPDKADVRIYDNENNRYHKIVNIFIGDEYCIEFGKPLE